MTTLIRMEGIKKVFTTDEVETHALSDINFSITEGEYVAISGPPAAVSTNARAIASRRSRRPTARGSATGRSASSSRPST